MSGVGTAPATGAAAHGVPWLSFLSLAASMALVGSYVGLSKILVVVFPIFLLAFLRFGMAALAMAGWVRRRRDEPRLTVHDRGLLFLESFFGNFLFSICMLFGVSMSSALAAGVIMAGIPAAVALLSRVFLKERIPVRTLLGIACAVGGIALVSFTRHRDGATGEHGTLLGNLLLLCAVLCEAIYVVIGKKLAGNVSPKRISALINLWGFALVTPLGVWQALRFDFNAVAASSWWLPRLLLDRGQRRHRLALDDRPEARAGIQGRHLHRAAAGERGGGRGAVPGRAFQRGRGAGLRACVGRRRAGDLAGPTLNRPLRPALRRPAAPRD